jgi:hypothetical protein
MLPIILGLKPDQMYAPRVDRQIYIRTSSEADAGLCKIYWRIGSMFSSHTGISDLKVVDTSRVKAVLLLLWLSVAKRDSVYS